MLICIILLSVVTACSPQSSAVGKNSELSSYKQSYDNENKDLNLEEFDPDIEVQKIQDICKNVLGNNWDNETDEQFKEISQQVSKLGISVVMENENMPNYKKVVDFYEKAKAGQNAKVIIYHNKALFAQIFTSNYGKISKSAVFFTSNGINKTKPQDVDEITRTERGNLIYHSGISSETSGFRVIPLPDICREYYKKYVVPVEIFADGPLLENWNNQDFGKLNWEWIYERLYTYKTGKMMLSEDSKYYHPGSKTTFDYMVIPAKEVEDLLQSYFDVSTKELREMKQYNEKTRTYTFNGFRGGGFTPTLEVTKYKENDDGSLTLWIDHIALAFGTKEEYGMLSILTVLPNDNGTFKYISNEYIKLS